MYNILIIEKKQHFGSLKKVVESYSTRSCEFDSVESAIEEMRKERFSLIFIDVDIVNDSPIFWKARGQYADGGIVVITSELEGFENKLFPVKKDVGDIVLKPYANDTIFNVVRFFGEKYSFQILKENLGGKVSASFDMTIGTKKAYVSYISKYLDNFFNTNFVDKIFSFKIAFEEALINAMHHGNKDDIEKKVHIKGEIVDGTISISIEDEGEGFDFALAMTMLTETQTNIFKTNGRGILMFSLYTDEFFYEENGRKVTLIKNI